MTKLTDHYFEVIYKDRPGERFITLAAAMTYVLDYPYQPGYVVYHRTEDSVGVAAMRMLPDNRWEALGDPTETDTATDESGA